jgi:hypothetical protein
MLRPICMRTVGNLLGTVALSLGLAACGSAQPGGQQGASSAPDVRLFGDCRAGDPALAEADVVAQANLDADGARTEIGYVSPRVDGPCAGALVTTLDGAPAAVRLPDAPPSLHDPVVIELRGTDRELLMLHGRPHPRGGYPVHLYGAAHGAIAEVLADGRPVVGFVATDGGAAPATASCTSDGGIATWMGIAHQPPGVVLAWDLWRTTYTLKGTTATKSSRDLVREAVADPLLRRDMPELFDPGAIFADCRAG